MLSALVTENRSREATQKFGVARLRVSDMPIRGRQIHGGCAGEHAGKSQGDSGGGSVSPWCGIDSTYIRANCALNNRPISAEPSLLVRPS